MAILKVVLSVLAIAFACVTSASASDECPSQVTISISSIGYDGAFAVELRSGTRPGSNVEDNVTMVAGDEHTFYDVCPGTYFFAIGPDTSDDVSVTSYFDVEFDGSTYNNPRMSVYYSSSTDGGQTVGKARKSDL